MFWNRQILAAVAALALTPWSMLQAEDQSATADLQTASADFAPVFTDGTPRADYEPMFLTRGQTENQTELATRFGWWGVSTSGSPVKVGEWQGLDSTAFYDIDGLSSDGRRTVNYHVTGADASEDTDAGLYVFGPNLTTDLEFQRFIHRLDHDPYSYFADTDANNSYIGRSTDLSVGQENAIRIQKFDARFKGKLTENVKWGLNLWGMRKAGDRQQGSFSHANSAQPCGGAIPTPKCHIQSQSQRIDWLTMEIQPVIEAKFGPATIEYSRTMRSFTQGDQTVVRDDYISPTRFLVAGSEHPYGQVSDNMTQIDRVKVGVDLSENTQFYGNLFYGDTENEYRQTHRNFDGWDLRLMNQTFDSLNLTGYAKQYNEKGQTPPFQPEDDQFTAGNNPGETVYQPGQLDGVIYPVARNTTKTGVKGRWEPFSDLRGFALTSGYEYQQIERQHVAYAYESDPATAVFTQPNTYSNELQFGTAMKFSRSTDTFVRYKMRSVRNPLYGFTANQVNSDAATRLADAVNTNLPTHEDMIELGGTWTPTSNFMLSTSIGLQKRYQDSFYAQSDENDYPMTFTAWYAPTCRWTVSGGLGFYSNWIDQDITIGKTASGNDAAVDLPFEYAGRSNVVNFGTTYACTDRLTLSGGYEYVRGTNVFADPTGAISLEYLSSASEVLVTTNRLSAGIDYLIRDGISTYFRYNYYDYNDESPTNVQSTNNVSGTAHMFLGGITATY